MAAEATTAMLPFFLSLASLFLLVANGVHSFEEQTLNVQKLQRKQHLGSMRSCILPESRREKSSIILEMKNRDHCSEKKEAENWNRRLQKQLVLDGLHVRSIQNRIRKRVSSHKNILEDDDDAASSELAQIPLTSGMKFQTLNYIVTLGLGSQNMTMIVDTGSDLTWVQCDPCQSCYNQQGPLFNPSTSRSYQPIPCNSTICQSLPFSDGKSSGACGRGNSSTCDYVVNYGDGSYTSGEIGLDHLSFGGVSVSGFVFGCGRNNKGLFGGASGLMGLGRSDLSLISQTNATFGGVFSYCLPSTEVEASSGSLVIGNDSSVLKNVTPIAYTRMVPNPQLSNFYVLNLTGISVGGVALELATTGFGVLIDSGTVITRLVPSVYKAVKAEFLKQFSGFPLVPGFSILDTCFNLTGYE